MFRTCFPWRPLVGYTKTRNALDAPQVIVTPCRDEDGEIQVLPPPGCIPPIKASWTGAQAVIRHSADTLRATHLRVGLYAVHVTDARVAHARGPHTWAMHMADARD